MTLPLYYGNITPSSRKENKKMQNNFDKMINDIDYNIRIVAVIDGTDEHRDKLVNDENDMVRAMVAARGNDSHRDKLVNDQSSFVRLKVAKYGNKKHASLLKNDVDELVSHEAKYQLFCFHYKYDSQDLAYYTEYLEYLNQGG